MTQVKQSRSFEYHSPFADWIPSGPLEYMSREDAREEIKTILEKAEDRAYLTKAEGDRCEVLFMIINRAVPDNRTRREDPHGEWFKARQDFERTGDPVHLEKMLSFVTDTNPPDAPKPVTPKPEKSGEMCLWYIWDVLLLVIGCASLLTVIIMAALGYG